MASTTGQAVVVHLPSPEYVRFGVAADVVRERLVSRWYEFQDLLFTRGQLWARLDVEGPGLNLPRLRVVLRVWPISSFAASARGVLHLVTRPLVTGGSRESILRCWTEQLSEAIVLHAEGEVDLTTASDLADAIANVSIQNGHIIVDFSHLDYLDGSGIRVLEHAAQTYHGRVIVVGSKPTTHKLFDILELTNVLPVVTTVEAAQERLRGR
jgi:anti-anti-sigma factor